MTSSKHLAKAAHHLTYDEIVEQTVVLSYRDKLRLAQLLIQTARKEEEEQHPHHRSHSIVPHGVNSDLVQYVAARIIKLRPTKRMSLNNAISAMFQFQGGISEHDRDGVIHALERQGVIHIDSRGCITYRE